MSLTLHLAIYNSASAGAGGGGGFVFFLLAQSLVVSQRWEIRASSVSLGTCTALHICGTL